MVRPFRILLSFVIPFSLGATFPKLDTRASQVLTGPAWNPYNTCGPLAPMNDSISPHDCTNYVRVSNSRNYYSVYLENNPYYSYNNSSVASDITGLDNSDTIFISDDWFLSCDASTICSNLPNVNENLGVPLGEWTFDLTSSGCLMGFYLPGPEEFPNGSNVTIPSRDDCEKRIMGPMLVELVANISASQAGGVLKQPLVNTATINVAGGRATELY